MLNKKQKQAIKDLKELLNYELEKAEKQHQETLKRHKEIMYLIEKAEKKE